MEYSFLLKFIIVGDPSVGKSCVMMSFIDKQFKIDTDPTIGVQFGSKNVTARNKNVKLQIWDTAGQEAYKSITRSYYRGTIGALLLYDITSRKSFQNLQKWLDQIANYAHNEKLRIMVVGNKSDLEYNRQVSYQEGLQFAEKQRFGFMQCSAKTGQNVEGVFISLSQNILQRIQSGQIDPRDESRGIKIGKLQPLLSDQKNRTCCSYS